MRPIPRPLLGILLVIVALLAVFPQFVERYYVQLATKIVVMAIFAMSLDLLVGYTRLVSLGHAAFFGLAGYALAVLQRDLGLVSLWTTLPLTLVVCALAALLVGALAIRTSGIYFIMVTLAIAQMLYYFANDTKALGGSDGMFLATKPTAELFGVAIFDLKNRTTFYYFALAALVASFLVARMVLASLFGRAVDAVRCNEPRARALGFTTWHYKLAMFTIAGTVAGLAGYVGAAQDGIVNPAFLSWHQSGQALVIVILGGMGTLYGPVVGAFVLIVLEDVAAGITEHWLLFIGVFVIAVVLLLPRGIASLPLGDFAGRLFGRGARKRAAAEPGDD
ncbi:MAG: branched-chain amino acid ABC transporter permease [Alphaproteobacteria bacterium]